MEYRKVAEVHKTIEVQVGAGAALIVHGDAMGCVVAHIGDVCDAVAVEIIAVSRRVDSLDS